MSAKVFVDTNVLVYARDTSAGEKQHRAADWLRHLWKERTGFVSYQVLQEFYVTVTRKLRPGMDHDSAREEVRTLFAWDPVQMDRVVMEGAWRFMEGASLSWWDALILAAAEVADCSYILTEDLQAGQQFGNLEMVDPFKTLPQGLL